MAPNKSLHLLTGSLSVKCMSYLPLQKGVMLSLSVPLKPLCNKTKKSHNINCSRFSMNCHCHTTEAHPGQCLGLNNYFFFALLNHPHMTEVLSLTLSQEQELCDKQQGLTSTLLLPFPMSLNNFRHVVFVRQPYLSNLSKEGRGLWHAPGSTRRT